MFNWGRVYFLQHLGEMVDELIDLCGRSAIMFPTEKQWQDPQHAAVAGEAQQGRRRRAL